MAKNMYQKKEQRKNKKTNDDGKSFSNVSINWYPGHMAKTRKEIDNILPGIDVVVEVVDARIPYSSHIPDLNTISKNKNVIIVFNKYDLCDKNETNKWKEYFVLKGYHVITSDSKNTNDYKKIVNEVELLQNGVNEKRKLKGLLPKKAKVLIIGVPNVGKSTLINKLIGRKILDVGNKPGVTKSTKTIRINDKIDLVDTPGILWPKIEHIETAYNLGSMSIIKEEILPLNELSYYILKTLYNYYPNIFKEIFKVDNVNIDDIISLYEIVSKSLSIPYSDEVDYEKVSVAILNLIKSEKIKDITFDRV